MPAKIIIELNETARGDVEFQARGMGEPTMREKAFAMALLKLLTEGVPEIGKKLGALECIVQDGKPGNS